MNLVLAYYLARWDFGLGYGYQADIPQSSLQSAYFGADQSVAHYPL